MKTLEEIRNECRNENHAAVPAWFLIEKIANTGSCAPV